LSLQQNVRTTSRIPTKPGSTVSAYEVSIIYNSSPPLPYNLDFPQYQALAYAEGHLEKFAQNQKFFCGPFSNSLKTRIALKKDLRGKLENT